VKFLHFFSRISRYFFSSYVIYRCEQRERGAETMSKVKLVIRDGQREIQANRRDWFADSVVAALSAEPETIEELSHALERFIATREGSYFEGFITGGDHKPYDGGRVVIDLPARLVVCDSGYACPESEGRVWYRDGKRRTDLQVRYHLSEDWLLQGDAAGWPELAEKRRHQRHTSERLDAREVLHGDPLLEFVARQCFQVFRDAGPAPRQDYSDPAYQAEYDQIKDIHVRWMMTPREDLRDQTPRSVMAEGRHFAEISVRDRQEQWSFSGSCPRPLDAESAAYRFAGFGIHESVVYYDMVRELLWRCRRHVSEYRDGESPVPAEEFVTAEVPRLRETREQWLDQPCPDFLHSSTPRSLIHNERARIPEAATEEEAIMDEDCPLCQMEAEFGEISFWHLDGSHMDNEFAFSLWRETYEEWEAEQQEWEEHHRHFDAKWKEIERLGVKYPGEGYADPDFVWRTSFSSEHCRADHLKLRLFTVGSHLADLIVDMKDANDSSAETGESEAGSDLTNRLRSSFAGLKAGVENPEPGEAATLLRPVLDDFLRILETAAQACPEVAIQCVELRDRFGRFLEPPREGCTYEDLLSGRDPVC
jgi:hypothetical protein